eukprot:10193145-Prorocentrum_lima.AAC.1
MGEGIGDGRTAVSLFPYIGASRRLRQNARTTATSRADFREKRQLLGGVCGALSTLAAGADVP